MTNYYLTTQLPITKLAAISSSALEIV